MTVIGCAMGLAGSQIYPLLYLTLGATIANDLGRNDLYVWMLTAGILAMGAIAPFVGPLADMIGRKSIFIVGFLCSIIGSLACVATPTAYGFIAGQVLLGFGAVMQELLAIAVVAEIVPTEKRPIFAVISLSAIIPWAPGTLYANYLASASWRYIGVVLAVWNLINLVMIAVWYNPPPRVNSRGLSRREQFARIDFVGGALIILGLLLFLVGLNAGGISYPWKSPRVLGPLVSGVGVMLLFALWEFFGAKYPLYPRRIVHVPRKFFAMIFVIFAAGINYIPLVVFWPVETIAVFQANLHRQGIYCLPIGICILGGAMLSAALLGIFPKKIHWTMFIFCVMQTIASACMVLVNENNIHTAWAPIVLALIGVGGVLVPNQVIITVITPDDLIASVTALTVGLRAQAQVVGLAIFYNQLQNRVTKLSYELAVIPMVYAQIYDPVLIKEIIQGLTSHPFEYYQQTIPNFRDNPAQSKVVMAACIQVFIRSLKLVWYITIAFGVAACIAAALMGDVSQYMDKHVAVVLTEEHREEERDNRV